MLLPGVACLCVAQGRQPRRQHDSKLGTLVQACVCMRHLQPHTTPRTGWLPLEGRQRRTRRPRAAAVCACPYPEHVYLGMYIRPNPQGMDGQKWEGMPQIRSHTHCARKDGRSSAYYLTSQFTTLRLFACSLHVLGWKAASTMYHVGMLHSHRDQPRRKCMLLSCMLACLPRCSCAHTRRAAYKTARRPATAATTACTAGHAPKAAMAQTSLVVLRRPAVPIH